MKKQRRIANIALGCLDILTGLSLIPFLFLYGFITFTAGLLYFIFGIKAVIGRLSARLLYWVVLFTIFHSIQLIILSMDQGTANYFRMTPLTLACWVLPLVFVGFLNIFFFCFLKKEERE